MDERYSKLAKRAREVARDAVDDVSLPITLPGLLLDLAVAIEDLNRKRCCYTLGGVHWENGEGSCSLTAYHNHSLRHYYKGEDATS